MRVQGWDPVMLICQIISLQTLHYLILSLLIPPILQALSNPVLLAYSGGPTTVSHILDWREMAARPTVSSSNFHGLLDLTSDGWQKLHGAWSGGKQIGEVVESETSGSEDSLDHHSPSSEDHSKGPAEDLDKWDMGVDEGRGWLLGFIWLVACAVDIAPLYYLIRRPTYILDFCLTLNFVHLILTTYHAKAFPTSIFYWVVQGLGALLMIVVAEQLCVKREMRTDLEISFKPVATDEAGEEIEMNRV